MPLVHTSIHTYIHTCKFVWIHVLLFRQVWQPQRPSGACIHIIAHMYAPSGSGGLYTILRAPHLTLSYTPLPGIFPSNF